MEAGEILLRRGLLDQRQLELSRNTNGDGASLVDAAVSSGSSPRKRRSALGEEVGLEFVDLAEVEVDLSLLKDFPQKLIYRQIAVSDSPQQRLAGRGHQRSVRLVSAGRSQRGDRSVRDARSWPGATRSPS